MLRRLSLVFALAVSLSCSCVTQLQPSVVPFAGRSVEVVEAGAGVPIVVFESGLGDDWSPWDGVAADVARRARVFAYSRPGYGASERTGSPRDPATVVEELRDLLRERDLPPPYVLVGHSFGGTYMEYFAKRVPDEVAGVVFVDTRHRDFAAACEAAQIPACAITPAMAATLPSPEREEALAFEEAPVQIADSGAFGSYPVRVLTADDHGMSEAFETLWTSQHIALAAEAPSGKQVAEDSGHYIHLDRKDDVVKAVLEIIDAN